MGIREVELAEIKVYRDQIDMPPALMIGSG